MMENTFCVMEQGTPPQHHVAGYHFSPDPKEVLTFYLPRIINKQPFPNSASIVDCDVYGEREPWKIFDISSDQTFFVFTKLKRKGKRMIHRTAGCGHWQNQSRKVVEDDLHNLIGYDTLLSYRTRDSSDAPKQNNGSWVMHEYSVEGHDYVICKIRNNSKISNDSDDVQEATISNMQNPRKRAAGAPYYNHPTNKVARLSHSTDATIEATNSNPNSNGFNFDDDSELGQILEKMLEAEEEIMPTQIISEAKSVSTSTVSVEHYYSNELQQLVVSPNGREQELVSTNADIVMDEITDHQGNVFDNNTWVEPDMCWEDSNLKFDEDSRFLQVLEKILEVEEGPTQIFAEETTTQSVICSSTSVVVEQNSNESHNIAAESGSIPITEEDELGFEALNYLDISEEISYPWEPNRSDDSIGEADDFFNFEMPLDDLDSDLRSLDQTMVPQSCTLSQQAVIAPLDSFRLSSCT